MKWTVLWCVILLAGCQSAAEPTKPSGPKLHTSPNSKERFQACAADYDTRSKHFIDCWSGRAVTYKEACMNGSELLDNRYLGDWRKAQLYETMRNAGCMGR